MLRPMAPAISLYVPRGDDGLLDVLARFGDSSSSNGVSAGPASY